MNYLELTEGETYVVRYSTFEYIVKRDKSNGSNVPYISLFGNPHFYKHGYFRCDFEVIRKATPSEAKWFEDCVKAGKFVPKSKVNEVIDDYQIY